MSLRQRHRSGQRRVPTGIVRWVDVPGQPKNGRVQGASKDHRHEFPQQPVQLDARRAPLGDCTYDHMRIITTYDGQGTLALGSPLYNFIRICTHVKLVDVRMLGMFKKLLGARLNASL